ncbi:major capsid protein P2 [Marinomonas algicola]|uniref:major capsid protein P2 n=1 Tax=Marinomonas algicola TaxID=2773454 RepID=UPI00174AAA14|nr:major capsid protein P2 [Marinomonas algicola]
MSRTITDKMQSPDGAIASNNTLQLAMGNGYVYENLYLDTNIPHDSLRKISVTNGSDDYLVTYCKEIVDVLEKHRNRTVGEIIPIRFSDPDAAKQEVQELTALVPKAGDSWLLKIELGTLPDTPPAGGWRFQVWRETSSTIKAVPDGKGGANLVQRTRTVERRLDRKVVTAAVEGVNTFDKLIKGPNINIRTIYLKGDITEIEFEGKRDGQIQSNWKLSKKLNEYLQKVRAQRNGIQTIDGYFIIDPVATGFAYADLMVTNYDEISLKFTAATGGTVEILTDYIKRIA